MRRRYSQTREDESEREIKEDVYSVIDAMKKELGLSIPKSKYPKIRVTGNRGEASYVGSTNTIEIGSERELMSGSVIGEEVGHYLRFALKPKDNDEILTDEFFGYLGARIMYKIAKQKGVEKELFPLGEPDYRLSLGGNKKIINQRLKNLRKGILELHSQYTSEKDKGKKKEIYKKGRELTDKREDILHHYRGYEFAQGVDLDKIQDYNELYSMPDKEVRRRFFRESKLYDIDKGIKKETRKKKGLEGKLAVLFFSSLFLSFLFSQNKITGNAIGNNGFFSSPISLIFLVIAICSGGLLIYRLITNK